MKTSGSLISLTFIFVSPVISAAVDFEKTFADRDACFVISDMKTGALVAEYNSKRCQERFSPCSSFKIAAALMAFEKGILKDENQILKWDGVQRDRAEINRDQTPFTWMSNSAKWVTEWIMPRLGEKSIQSFLDGFGYGNKDFSGGLKDAWQTTSLKISAHEQIEFISKLWKDQLPVSKRTSDLTKKIIRIKNLGKNSELFGKTGTGCLSGHECLEHPDKMIGWFVGVLENPTKKFAIAANASDLKPQKAPAGPRMRQTTIEVLQQLGLVAE